MWAGTAGGLGDSSAEKLVVRDKPCGSEIPSTLPATPAHEPSAKPRVVPAVCFTLALEASFHASRLSAHSDRTLQPARYHYLRL